MSQILGLRETYTDSSTMFLLFFILTLPHIRQEGMSTVRYIHTFYNDDRLTTFPLFCTECYERIMNKVEGSERY
jgi:hypothetical protein